jgi:hypothetical protein
MIFYQYLFSYFGIFRFQQKLIFLQIVVSKVAWKLIFKKANAQTVVYIFYIAQISNVSLKSLYPSSINSKVWALLPNTYVLYNVELKKRKVL